eukprot:CAMPEP_0198610332 /NCGR_PEP_ID=MMETSP1462-20131121/156839_1 /TAXON_ID=1333877 /ORGANISM="Brandtodinium nutriculum, Strain RCC3387" /LENGTH=858 /DNA_ID=CAMNT_0044342137 /DNA_START=35 /DNA_END=2612 /DNA_ORIENTATION=+
MTSASEPRICDPGGSGIVFPLFGESEHEWPQGLRIFLYMLGLFWCFMGVAIVADVFVGSIDQVTQKKIRYYDSKTMQWKSYVLWNETIANLSLMALGSSAPEILLNVIDIIAKDFYLEGNLSLMALGSSAPEILLNVIDIIAKDFYLEGLGPGTIVGSAAFNLLMIIALCIVVIDDGDVRYIKQLPVYCVTATWSIFAYVWLTIILLVSSPNVVEMWEGVLTFAFFPIFLLNAFAADKGWLGGKTEEPTKKLEDMTMGELAQREEEVRTKFGEHLTYEQVFRYLQAHQTGSRNSQAHYRAHATRSLFGGKGVKLRTFAKNLTSSMSFLGSRAYQIHPQPEEEEVEPACWFYFSSSKQAVFEGEEALVLKVLRDGDKSFAATVHYETGDISAIAGKKYQQAKDVLEFPPGCDEMEISIKIHDDDEFDEAQPDQTFFVKLSQAESKDAIKRVKVGDTPKVTVTIIDDDDPGIVTFELPRCQVCQPRKGATRDFQVLRRNGSKGECTVKYHTEDGTARAGVHYEATKGVLHFPDKVVVAEIPVNLLPVSRFDEVDTFKIFLSDASGAKMGLNSELEVSITADESGRASAAFMLKEAQKQKEEAEITQSSWIEQFRDAIKVGCDEDHDEEKDGPYKPSAMEYAMHVITVPWKLIFACCPPAPWCGGWLAFVVSLGMTGGVTMLIGDLASLLGCSMEMPETITAITFVALGTSLPDAFASKTAAQTDLHADNSVGNVTGSNSVNVFLGLGLPWMMATIVWALRGTHEGWNLRFQYDADLAWLGDMGSRPTAFVVKAGSLAFSVTVFSCCAVLCISLLALRRWKFGGELGGPTMEKWASAGFLTLLWFTYIGLSSWRSLQDLQV